MHKNLLSSDRVRLFHDLSLGSAKPRNYPRTIRAGTIWNSVTLTNASRKRKSESDSRYLGPRNSAVINTDSRPFLSKGSSRVVESRNIFYDPAGLVVMQSDTLFLGFHRRHGVRTFHVDDSLNSSLLEKSFTSITTMVEKLSGLRPTKVFAQCGKFDEHNCN